MNWRELSYVNQPCFARPLCFDEVKAAVANMKAIGRYPVRILASRSTIDKLRDRCLPVVPDPNIRDDSYYLMSLPFKEQPWIRDGAYLIEYSDETFTLCSPDDDFATPTPNQ